MTRPEGVKVVVPVNTAEFHARQWDCTDAGFMDIDWMANQFGWVLRIANDPTVLHINGRNRKKYTVKQTDWVIALGANGSIRVCSDRQYRQDYREASA